MGTQFRQKRQRLRFTDYLHRHVRRRSEPDPARKHYSQRHALQECSWGQHFFHYETPQSYAEINAQQELNIHNINLARLLGLSETGPYYERLGNLTVYLNPLFYALCVTAWLILPAAFERSDAFRNLPVFKGFPVQSRCFYLTFAAFTAAYLIVDRVLFDAGELFELTLSTSACVASIYQAIPTGQR